MNQPEIAKKTVKSFHAQAFEGYQHQVESTHAKILLTDRKSAYLGSAEIRANALFNNFEVGIHTTDSVVISDILKILHLVWTDVESCRIINREEIEQKIRFILQGTHIQNMKNMG